jgi:hypothetical protein
MSRCKHAVAWALLAACGKAPAGHRPGPPGPPETPLPADAAGPADGAAPSPPAPDAAPHPASDTAAPPAGWWDPRWHKRARVTIADAELKEELADFQVPIKLEAPAFDHAAARPDGSDVRFVADDGGVRLDHEIDVWNAGGVSWLWLKLPRLGAAPTTLWVYYGNETAAADGDPHAVWPEPYAGVWHLSGNGKDSTAHGFDGAQMVGGSFADARFAKGYQLDGSKRDHIALKNDIKLVAGAPGCTFSAWINPTRIEDSVNGMIIMTVGKWFNTNHNSYTDFNINAAGQLISHIDPGPNTAASGYSRILSDPGFIKPNEWAWVTYVIDLPGRQERFFKNGQLVSTKPPPGGKEWASAFIDMVSTRVVIGAEEDVVSHFYTGAMDELRLEKGMRTPAWIAAQYRAMTVPGFVRVTPD